MAKKVYTSIIGDMDGINEVKTFTTYEAARDDKDKTYANEMEEQGVEENGDYNVCNDIHMAVIYDWYYQIVENEIIE